MHPTRGNVFYIRKMGEGVVDLNIALKQTFSLQFIKFLAESFATKWQNIYYRKVESSSGCESDSGLSFWQKVLHGK